MSVVCAAGSVVETSWLKSIQIFMYECSCCYMFVYMRLLKHMCACIVVLPMSIFESYISSFYNL